MKCTTRPVPNVQGVLQKPSTAIADRNEHNERDPEAWDDVGPVRVHMRNRRATEIVAVDQVEAVRFWRLETYGTATTRQAKSSWRFTWTDRDGVVHSANFTGVMPEPDGTWVLIDAEEKV